MGVSKVVDGVARMWFPGIDNNAFLISTGGSATLVDTGPPGHLALVLKALRRGGLGLPDVRQVVVTHCHSDHTGNLAAVVGGTGVTVYGHAADAEIVRNGAERPRGTPNGLLGRVLQLGAKGSSRADAAPVHVDVSDGQVLADAAGLRCIHTPGHTSGHVSYLWGGGGVLFVGDAAANMFRHLDVAPINEDVSAARASFARLADLDFDVACFGHGSPIRGGAAGRFRRRLARVTARTRA